MLVTSEIWKRPAVVVAGVLLLWLLPLSYAASVELDANESRPFWSSRMAMHGMCGEIVYAASKSAGIESSITFKPLKRMIEDDTNNDLGNPAFYMGNQDFSAIIPIAVYHVALFYYRPNHTDHPVVHGLKDLKGHKIGLLKGTLVDRSYFQNAGITFEESYSQESLFRKLKKGRVDLVVEVDLVGRHIINTVFPAQRENFVAELIPGSGSPIAILLSENQPDGRATGERYRQGLEKIRQSGEYLEILEKYYGKEALPEHYFSQLDRFSFFYHQDDE